MIRKSGYRFSGEIMLKSQSSRQFRGHGRDASPAPPFAEWRQRHHGGIQPQHRRCRQPAGTGARPRHGRRAGHGRHRDRADLSFAAGPLRSRADRFRQARRTDSRARAAAGTGNDKDPALAHSGGLWRRARHRPRGRRQNPQHHARRDRGAACRRRLPGRHDRLYARLVLSQRAARIPCTCRGGRTRAC